MRVLTGVAVLALIIAGGASNMTAAQAAGAAGAQAAAEVTPEQIDAAMKTISTTNGALGTKLTGGDLAGAVGDAKALAAAFETVERFFVQKNKADATGWATQGKTGATEVAAAAAAGDAEKANAARSNVAATCKQCHTVYREGDPAGGFRIKAGTI